MNSHTNSDTDDEKDRKHNMGLKGMTIVIIKLNNTWPISLHAQGGAL